MKKIYRQYTDDQLMLSDNYGKHVSAMTGEALHSKSDIAAELAIRDDEISELKAQLVEVNNNRTGVSPCTKFCEALAAKNMFDNLQQENTELKAQVEQLHKYIEDAKGWHNEESIGSALAESSRAAFIAGYELCQSAQPIPAMLHHNLQGFSDKYANQIRQQANPFDKINKARDEASSALQNWIDEAGD